MYNKRTLSNYTNIFLNENSLPSCPLNFLSSDNQSVGNASLIAPYSCHPELVSDSNEMQKQRGQSDVQHDMTNYPLPQSLAREREVKKLSSPFTLHSSLKRKAAFTLAEVLITLGIIGVVAAMTIPTLVAKYKEKELITKTKKAYSVIQNAVLLAKSKNDIIDDNTFLFDPSKTSAQVAEDFSQYFNGAKLCLDRNSNGCKDYYYDVKFATKEGGYSLNYPKIILTDGTNISVAQQRSCYRVNNTDCVQDSNGNCVTDADGNTTPATAIHTDCASLYFDVNGAKLPNQFGRDNYKLKVLTNSIKGSDWAPEGATSLKNILTGKDKLEYIKF